MDRRELLAMTGAAALAPGRALAQHPMHGSGPAGAPAAGKSAAAQSVAAARGPVVRLEIVKSRIELAKGVSVSTTTYNGRFPGPLLRFTAGEPVAIDVQNRTDRPEQLHWHGQFLPAAVDGAEEEGTPFIPAGGRRRIAFTPGPSGLRLYHSHLTVGGDLTRGLYSGQMGPVYIAPRGVRASSDREVFLTLKEFGASRGGMEMSSAFLLPSNPVRELFNLDRLAVVEAEKRGVGEGHELGYRFHTINGRMLGHGPPIRVKAGERVMFHIVNGSASEVRSLALPGHVFRVVALDGNPVPRPAEAAVLWMGPGERISATVEMTQPGVWVMGDVDDMARGLGMGVVIEYAGRAGPPVWRRPARSTWDYRRFALPKAVSRRPDEIITLTFATRYAARNGFNEFTINGSPFSMRRMEPRFPIRLGRRYRLRLRNATDDVHPIHLHRHSFEITSVAGMPVAGVLKDVILVGAFQEATIDFTADQPGLSLLHCHMQHHMDFGFMALFDAR